MSLPCFFLTYCIQFLFKVILSTVGKNVYPSKTTKIKKKKIQTSILSLDPVFPCYFSMVTYCPWHGQIAIDAPCSHVQNNSTESFYTTFLILKNFWFILFFEYKNRHCLCTFKLSFMSLLYQILYIKLSSKVKLKWNSHAFI